MDHTSVTIPDSTVPFLFRNDWGRIPLLSGPRNHRQLWRDLVLLIGWGIGFLSRIVSSCTVGCWPLQHINQQQAHSKSWSKAGLPMGLKFALSDFCSAQHAEESHIKHPVGPIIISSWFFLITYLLLRVFFPFISTTQDYKRFLTHGEEWSTLMKGDWALFHWPLIN